MYTAMSRKQSQCTLVHDGDTFYVSNGDSIRLARVNAPELSQPSGTAAKSKLESLVLNQTVTYEVVGTSYHRLVAEVWVGGLSVSDAMIAAGYG